MKNLLPAAAIAAIMTVAPLYSASARMLTLTSQGSYPTEGAACAAVKRSANAQYGYGPVQSLGVCSCWAIKNSNGTTGYRCSVEAYYKD